MGKLPWQQTVGGDTARSRHGSFLVAVVDFLMATGTHPIGVLGSSDRMGPRHNTHH